MVEKERQGKVREGKGVESKIRHGRGKKRRARKQKYFA